MSPVKIFRLGLLAALAILVIPAWLDDPQEKIWDAGAIHFYHSQRVRFDGVIVDEPDKRINHTKYTIAAAMLEGTDTSVSGRVLVSAGLYPEFLYGDIVRVSCRLQRPEAFDGFAYDRFLAKSDIYSICSFAQIDLIKKGAGNVFLVKIFQFKKHLQAMINQSLPEPQASILSAMVLGSRRGIPAEVFENFSFTGTAHLIAISGLHITILSAIALQVFLTLGLDRKKSFWLITFLLVFYITMIGFPPSAVRAGVMGFLLMFAMYLGRLSQASNSILLAALVMLFINPKLFRDAIGFQLSFSAVLGIIYFSPYFERYCRRLPATFGLRQIMTMSFSAQLSTLPLVIFHFGRASLIGPLANMLVLPLMPYVMVAGFTALVAGTFFSFLTPYVFWPAHFLLTLIIGIIEFLSFVPYAAVTV